MALYYFSILITNIILTQNNKTKINLSRNFFLIIGMIINN